MRRSGGDRVARTEQPHVPVDLLLDAPREDVEGFLLLRVDLAPEATAILSMSVMQGIAIVAEARRRGRETPRDLPMVGFNDTPAAAAGRTTMAAPPTRAASPAAS